MEWLLGLLSGLLILLVIFLHLSKTTKIGDGIKPGPAPVPEPPGAWPILGHIPLLNNRELPRFRLIGKLADECGVIFGLRLGVKSVVFVNSWEAAKECFTVHDKALNARPSSTAFGKFIFHDASFGMCSGSYWKEIRKITMQELLSPTKLSELKQFQLREIEHFISELQHSCTQNSPEIVLSEWFSRESLNVITMLLARKRHSCDPRDDDATKVHKTVTELLHTFALPVITDAFPSSLLEWLDPQDHIRKMKRVSKHFDEVVVAWVDEHQRRSMPHHQRGEEDFIDVLLREVGKGKLNFDHLRPKDVIVSATVETLITGAADTIAVALTWTIALLLNHPHVMERAKEEMDRVVGRERWAEQDDIERLVYLNAIINETLRIYPSSTMGAPHYATEDCIIGGYKVKKGTTLLCNFWKLHRDPKVWEDPQEFKPERFLGKEIDEGIDFTYIPFGIGRRICPGKDMAEWVIPMTVARLLQGFELSRTSTEPVDMTEGFEASLHKATPLEVVVTPRLSSKMYHHYV